MLTLWDLNTPFQIDVLQLKSLYFDPNQKIICSYGFILVVNGSGNTLASNRRLDITRSNDDQVKSQLYFSWANGFKQINKLS